MTTTTMARPAERRAANTQGWDRLAGLGAIGFAALVATANVAVHDTPAFDASGSEVARWVHDHHTAAALLSLELALTVPCLLAFLGGFVARIWDEDGSVRAPALAGAFGGLMIGALFGTVAVMMLALVGMDGSSTAAEIGLVWHLHSAAFVSNMVAVGTAACGISIAASRVGLAPRWYSGVGVAALVCGVLAAATGGASVNGAGYWQIGFVAFVAWLLLLAITGVNLLRRPAR